MLFRSGARGSEAELSALQAVMVRKGSRGLSYFDLKKFLESYGEPSTLVEGKGVVSTGGEACVSADADQSTLRSTQQV